MTNGLMNLFKSYGCKVLDSTWLLSFLPIDIFEKISYVKNLNKNLLEVAVLINKKSDIGIANIRRLAVASKVLNIITNDVGSFRFLEKELVERYGILINVSSNKEKSCARADVIFNFDFSDKELNRCKMKVESVLVQLNGKNYDKREGIVIRNLKLNLPYKFVEKFECLEHFDLQILYEGSIFYKTSFENVRKLLKRDNIQIRFFIGNNGRIAFNEFLFLHWEREKCK